MIKNIKSSLEFLIVALVVFAVLMVLGLNNPAITYPVLIFSFLAYIFIKMYWLPAQEIKKLGVKNGG